MMLTQACFKLGGDDNDNVNPDGCLIYAQMMARASETYGQIPDKTIHILGSGNVGIGTTNPMHATSAQRIQPYLSRIRQ